MSTPSKILLFACGNPGRGDDGLGPLLLERIEARRLNGVQCLSDMQWQVEHVIDLVGRACILFVDADVSCTEPYAFHRIGAERDGSYTTHAMTPGSLLHAFRQVYGSDAPPAWVLRIRGYDFELGHATGERACINLEAAEALARRLCAHPSEAYWSEQSSISAGSQTAASSRREA